MVRYAAFSKRLARTQDHGKPACARKPHPDASSKPQSRHRRQRLEEGKGSLFIDKDEKQPKQFAGDASGRGDDCRQEGVAHAWSSVTLPIFMMIQPSPLPAERARSMSGWHRVRFFFGGYHCYQRCHGSREPLRWRWRPHESHSGQSGDIQVRHIVLILSARDSGDIPGGGAIASLAEEGHDASLGVVVALGSGGQETTASADVVPISIIRPMAGALATVRARGARKVCAARSLPRIKKTEASRFSDDQQNAIRGTRDEACGTARESAQGRALAAGEHAQRHSCQRPCGVHRGRACANTAQCSF